MVLANNGPGLVVYGVAFYELDPPYICVYNEPIFKGQEPDDDNSNQFSIDQTKNMFNVGSSSIGPDYQFTYTTSCDRETVCENKDQNTNLVSYYIDTDSIYYIKNWIEQLNIECIPSAYIGFLGALAFAGAAFSCFIVPALGDKYGRWLVWLITIICQLPLYFGANLTSYISVVYITTFYLGMGLIGRFACGFVLFTESLPKAYQSMMGAMYAVGDIFATYYITFFLRYISNDANTLIWIGFAINILACICGFFLVESPAWLLSSGNKAGAIKNLEKIARINGVVGFEVWDLKDEKFETVDPKKVQEDKEKAEQARGPEIDIEEVDASDQDKG